jgi:oxygen-independent coproporphyrinogen-3 oxidase
MKDLVEKYNVAAPRYTSYPTVPYWDKKKADVSEWKEHVAAAFAATNVPGGISLYIHLPYCESLCTYCGCNTRITVNHRVEQPYIDAVLQEWNMYRELFGDVPNLREIHLGGGTPTFFSPENLARLIDGLTAGATLHPSREFGFEAHPGNTRPEHLRVLYDRGFRRISFGIQDFDPVVQDVINRYQTFAQVKDITGTARAMGYTSVNYDLIYGLPLQRMESVTDTVEKVRSLQPDRIAFYSYAHVPWIKPGQRKFTELDLPDGPAKRALYERGRSLLEEAGYQEIGMDHFARTNDSLFAAAREGMLHRNFMGYTTTPTRLLVGLGVSSIGDSWTAFAQNVKTVEEYEALVKSGVLPVFRGHVLTGEDRVIRQHILNLMCRGFTTWRHPEERLKPLEDDGLVKRFPYEIRITETGRAFLRNICMALDARLWRQQPETEIFSKTA